MSAITCMVSHIPIQYGDRVVLVFLIERDDVRFHNIILHPDSRYSPLFLPFRGEYDDGEVSDFEGDWDRLHQILVDKIPVESQRNIDFEDLLGLWGTWKSRLVRQTLEGLQVRGGKITLTWIREDVYDYLSLLPHEGSYKFPEEVTLQKRIDRLLSERSRDAECLNTEESRLPFSRERAKLRHFRRDMYDRDWRWENFPQIIDYYEEKILKSEEPDESAALAIAQLDMVSLHLYSLRIPWRISSLIGDETTYGHLVPFLKYTHQLSRKLSHQDPESFSEERLESVWERLCPDTIWQYQGLIALDDRRSPYKAGEIDPTTFRDITGAVIPGAEGFGETGRSGGRYACLWILCSPRTSSYIYLLQNNDSKEWLKLKHLHPPSQKLLDHCYAINAPLPDPKVWLSFGGANLL